jgi:hypothetical protein
MPGNYNTIRRLPQLPLGTELPPLDPVVHPRVDRHQDPRIRLPFLGVPPLSGYYTLRSSNTECGLLLHGEVRGERAPPPSPALAIRRRQQAGRLSYALVLTTGTGTSYSHQGNFSIERCNIDWDLGISLIASGVDTAQNSRIRGWIRSDTWICGYGAEYVSQPYQPNFRLKN